MPAASIALALGNEWSLIKTAGSLAGGPVPPTTSCDASKPTRTPFCYIPRTATNTDDELLPRPVAAHSASIYRFRCNVPHPQAMDSGDTFHSA